MLYPSYEKTYGSGTFFEDIKGISFDKFMYKISCCENPFKDVVRARYIALTQKRTKANRDEHKRGTELLLPFQKEWKKNQNIQKIQDLKEMEKEKAQRVLEEKMKGRLRNGS